MRWIHLLLGILFLALPGRASAGWESCAWEAVDGYGDWVKSCDTDL